MARLVAGGSGDRIIGTSSTPINFNYNAPFTVGGWFMPISGNWDVPVSLYGHLDTAANYAGWELEWSGTRLTLFLINSWPTTAVRKLSPIFTLAYATWFHFVATYDGSTFGAGITLYSSGVPFTTGLVTTPDSLGNNSIQNAIPPRIGARTDSTETLPSARVADIGAWNVVLTAGEVAGLYNGRRPWMVRPGALVHYWPLDGLQSPEPDLSGNANNGTLTGTALANGPPVTMFTPRWPRNYDAVVTTVPLAQSHFRFRTDTGAVDATPTWGDAEDAA